MYKAVNLIADAYYLSGVVSRELEDVSGSQSTDAVRWLNGVLNELAFHDRMVPYYELYEFDTEANVEKYHIPGLIDPETITFDLQSVRIPSRQKSFRRFFGSYRAENVQSLPFTFGLVRKVGGCDLYLYFKPDKVYPIKIWGKFYLTGLTLQTDLSSSYDTAYTEYFKYLLARKICNEYSRDVPAGIVQEINRYDGLLIDAQPMDFTIKKIGVFDGELSLDYPQINLGEGWQP